VQSNWYRELDKPSWQPPDVVFGPVWTVIYALIATSMIIVRRSRGDADQRPLSGAASMSRARSASAVDRGI
jgi:translocator protein